MTWGRQLGLYGWRDEWYKASHSHKSGRGVTIMVLRLSRALLASTALVAAVASVGVAGTSAVAVAADPAVPGDPSVPVASGSPLPLAHVGDLVVDEPHGHVFVSGGQAENSVVVADLAGHPVDTIPDLAGADGMLLSADGSTLYVALATGQGVAGIDTATLAVTTYPTPGLCPRDLSQVGTVLYVTATCGGSNGDVFYTLSRLDPETDDVGRVTLSGQQDQGFYYSGSIVSDPAYPGRLFVVDQWDYQGNVRAFDLDPTGLQATRVASASFGIYPVNGIGFSEDHHQLLVAHGDGVTALDPADLSQARKFDWAPPANAVAAGSGYVASARGVRVVVNRGDGSFGRSYYFDEPVSVNDQSLGWASNRLFVEAWDGSTMRLFAFTDFATPGPLLTYGISTGGHVVQEPHEITGWLDLGGQPFAGTVVHAWRSGPDGMVDIGSDVSKDDGAFALTDTPPAKGTYHYTVLYDGEPGVAPEKWVFDLPVTGQATLLTLDQPPVFTRDQPLHLQGSLVARRDDRVGRSDDTPIGDALLSVTDTLNGQTRDLDPVRTDADGRFALDLPPGELGDHVFKVTYAGDPTYAPDSDADHLWVKHAVSLTITPPPAPLVSSQPMVFHGTVTDDDGQPVPGQSVTWQRWTGDPATVAKTGTVTTGADGGFTFTNQNPGRGVFRWTVVSKGDASHDVGSAEASSPVYSFFAPLEIRTDRTIYDYGSQATVEGWANDGAHGTVRLYAQPEGGTRSSLAQGPTVTGRDVFATMQAARNTALSLAFEPADGDYVYAPTEVSSALAVRPVLQQGLRGSYAKDGHTYLVHRSVDPRLTLKTKPALPGRCVHVRVQRYRSGAYRLTKLTGCVRLDANSEATWTLTGSPPAGARFRLRYEAPADPAYASANSPWAYIRFTR